MKNINKIKAEMTAYQKTNNKLLNGMHLNTSYTRTQNGALTFDRTESPLLDFYAQAGAMRKSPEKALDLFKKAFSEDRLSAIKILFYLRDVRGGQGERTLFRTCLEWLGTDFPEVFEKIIKFIPEYGRFDDLFFDNDIAIQLIKNTLENDKKVDTPTLLAKWLPTINASSANTKAKAKFMATKLGMKPISYRKTIRAIRKKIQTVEEKMSANKWAEIAYETVPSQANRIYKDAFKKHDEKRYSAFIDKATSGETKINASTLYPYQIYNSVHNNYSKTLEALWNALPDYTQEKNALVVADTSGSMSGDPMSVSVSLALYFAERNKGAFKDHFITFSMQPKLQQIRGATLLEKMNSIQTGEVANTDLVKVFELILNTAIQNKVPNEEMPETIYLISDMEFDSACAYRTTFEVIDVLYKQNGYKRPNIVFWNVNASGSNLPVRAHETGATLVSGFSPVVFKMAVENKTPMQVMLDTINAPRYAQIEI